MRADRAGIGVLTAARYGFLPAFLALGGCGGPSASDIKGAVQETWTAAIGPIAPIFDTVTDVDCRAQGKPGFVCTYNVIARDGLTNAKESELEEARFVQSGSKWIMMKEK